MAPDTLSTARAALAAFDLAHDLARRATRLMDAALKLRAKGKTGALAALLDDDAVSAAAPILGLSDRARRRLFERLVALGPFASSPAAPPSGCTGSDPHGAPAKPRTRPRPRPRRPAGRLTLAGMEGAGRGGAVRRGEAGDARHPRAGGRARLLARASARRPSRGSARTAD